MTPVTGLCVDASLASGSVCLDGNAACTKATATEVVHPGTEVALAGLLRP